MRKILNVIRRAEGLYVLCGPVLVMALADPDALFLLALYAAGGLWGVERYRKDWRKRAALFASRLIRLVQAAMGLLQKRMALK